MLYTHIEHLGATRKFLRVQTYDIMGAKSYFYNEITHNSPCHRQYTVLFLTAATLIHQTTSGGDDIQATEYQFMRRATFKAVSWIPCYIY